MIITENHGPLVVSSTYWGSDLEAAGKIHLSCNAGAIRMLLPASVRHYIREQRAAAYAVLSRGPWPDRGLADAVEILWEDHSDSPFAQQFAPESFDLLPGEPSAGQEWVIAVYDNKKNRPHKCLERRCSWRRVPRIPWLKPWDGDEERKRET